MKSVLKAVSNALENDPAQFNGENQIWSGAENELKKHESDSSLNRTKLDNFKA